MGLARGVLTMPNAYLKEFLRDFVQVAGSCEPTAGLARLPAHFGVLDITLSNCRNPPGDRFWGLPGLAAASPGNPLDPNSGVIQVASLPVLYFPWFGESFLLHPEILCR